MEGRCLLEELIAKCVEGIMASIRMAALLLRQLHVSTGVPDIRVRCDGGWPYVTELGIMCHGAKPENAMSLRSIEGTSGWQFTI